MDSTEVFREEERNLAATLAKVHEALARATRVSESTNDARRETKFYLSANRGEIDPQEMQQHERLLCEADLQAEQAHLARERLGKLADSPYFARVSFVPDGEGSMPQVAGTHADGDTTAEGDAAARGHAATDGKAPTLDAYIGRFSFGDADGTVVSDWRSPVASLFYDFEPGPASYDAPAGTRTGTLAGKRHLSIEGGNLRSAFEDGSAIRDEVLGYELGKTSDNAMRTIVASIQREQNAVIRDETTHTLVIQGVAGSGKTSIALHRVAYLLYRRKGSLSARSVAVLSPNKVFGDYIAGVLPELGEEPIQETGLRDVVTEVLKGVVSVDRPRSPIDDADAAWQKRARFKGTERFAEDVAAFADQAAAEAFVAEDLAFGTYVVEKERLQARFQRCESLPIAERIEVVAADVMVELHAKRIGRRFALPKKAEVKRKLTGMLRAKDALGLYRLFLRRTGDERMLHLPAKNTVEWEDACALAFFQSAFDGWERFSDVQHLVVDEMQDLTPIQHRLVARLFPCEKTILGDIGQAVDPANGVTLDALARIYGGATVHRLMRSYRSTFEISQLAARVKPIAGIQAVRRHGEAPRIVACGDTQGVLDELDCVIAAFQASGRRTLGIVHKSNAVVQRYGELLARRHDVHVITMDSTEFSAGVSLAPVTMAKGLEFDEVAVLDADDAQYCTDFDRNLLYVALTRALHKLTVLYRTRLTRFLA